MLIDDMAASEGGQKETETEADNAYDFSVAWVNNGSVPSQDQNALDVNLQQSDENLNGIVT